MKKWRLIANILWVGSVATVATLTSCSYQALAQESEIQRERITELENTLQALRTQLQERGIVLD